MSDPILLVPGTHGYAGDPTDQTEWWWPGSKASAPSPWVQRARTRGLTILSASAYPFTWDTELHVRGRGTGRAIQGWKAWGDALCWYLAALNVYRVQLLAHSHGGQVAAYALARRPRWPGFECAGLVTLGTPERDDMRPIYSKAQEALPWWEHVRGGTHWLWEWAGTWGDGPETGPMRWAHHTTAIPRGEPLTDPATWDRHQLWRFLEH